MKDPNILLSKHLRNAASELDKALRVQLDATLEAPLDLRRLIKHVAKLASDVESKGVVEAGVSHKDFAVTPHAVWLARRARGKRSPESYRMAGAKGGSAQSLAKKRAATENGRLGGRPKKRYQDLVDRLVRLAKDPNSDPYCTPEFAPKLLRQMSSLPVRVRLRLRRLLRSAKIDPSQYGLFPRERRKVKHLGS